MTPEEYRERAEHCRQVKAAAKDDFVRRYLAVVEQSYRVLADSEEALQRWRMSKISLDRNDDRPGE